MGKLTITGVFSIAMLNYQRVQAILVRTEGFGGLLAISM